MTKLLTLILLVSPVISLFRGTGFSFDETVYEEDASFLAAAAKRAEEREENAVESWLQTQYGIEGKADVDFNEDGSYSAKSVKVCIADFGIYEDAAHIDISLHIEEALEEQYGCEAEIIAGNGEGE